MDRITQKEKPDKRLHEGAKIVANQLGRANTHLHFFRELLTHYSDFGAEKDFWDYTLAGHIGMTIRDVSVIYDTHKKGINLINLLGLIDLQSLDIINGKKLAEFLVVVGKLSADPVIRVLREWRNNIVAHYNNEIARTDREGFLNQNPLDETKLQYLIDKGFEIVEWCVQIECPLHSYPRFAPGKDDHEKVLAKLRYQSQL